MREYLVNDHRIFDTGNDLQRTATLSAMFDVDIEHTFESLRPCHGRVAFGFCFIVLGLVLWYLSTLPAPSGCDMDAMPTVRRENTMEPG